MAGGALLCWLLAGQGAMSPYQGQETREIKALSQAEVQGYLGGEGMGLAKAAELNSYPGPKHVLELAEALGLAPAQRAAVQASFDAMRARAVDLGVRLVDQERRLDRLFAEGRIDPQALEELTAGISRLAGQIRHAHLLAHLETRAVLTPAQIDEYRRRRGYDPGGHRHVH
jgi:hypothetical protein